MTTFKHNHEHHCQYHWQFRISDCEFRIELIARTLSTTYGICSKSEIRNPKFFLVHPFAKEGWLRLTGMADEQELRLLGELPPRLQRGEASCLAIAHHRGWTLLTDDQAARKEAERLGIRISGTVGCLVLSVERDLCTLEQANTWLAEMIQQGYRSPVTDLTPLLKHR